MPAVLRSQELAYVVRKKLVPCTKNLLQHGLGSGKFMSFLSAGRPLDRLIHVWQLILLFCERENGEVYNNSSARKLSQSFDLDIEEARHSTVTPELLGIIGYIISTHSPCKRSFNSHFKAFICAALNSGRLMAWLRVVIACRKLVDRYYQPWS